MRFFELNDFLKNYEIGKITKFFVPQNPNAIAFNIGDCTIKTSGLSIDKSLAAFSHNLYILGNCLSVIIIESPRRELCFDLTNNKGVNKWRSRGRRPASP